MLNGHGGKGGGVSLGRVLLQVGVSSRPRHALLSPTHRYKRGPGRDNDGPWLAWRTTRLDQDTISPHHQVAILLGPVGVLELAHGHNAKTPTIGGRLGRRWGGLVIGEVHDIDDLRRVAGGRLGRWWGSGGRNRGTSQLRGGLHLPRLLGRLRGANDGCARYVLLGGSSNICWEASHRRPVDRAGDGLDPLLLDWPSLGGLDHLATGRARPGDCLLVDGHQSLLVGDNLLRKVKLLFYQRLGEY